MNMNVLGSKIAWEEMVAGNLDLGQAPIGKTTPSFEDVQNYINKNYNHENREIVAIVNKKGDVLADLTKMSAAEKDAAVKKWLESDEEVSFKLKASASAGRIEGGGGAEGSRRNSRRLKKI